MMGRERREGKKWRARGRYTSFSMPVYFAACSFGVSIFGHGGSANSGTELEGSVWQLKGVRKGQQRSSMAVTSL